MERMLVSMHVGFEVGGHVGFDLQQRCVYCSCPEATSASGRDGKRQWFQPTFFFFFINLKPRVE